MTTDSSLALLDRLRAQREVAAPSDAISHALTLAIDMVREALPAIELEARGQPEPPDVECDCGGYSGWFGTEHDTDCAAFVDRDYSPLEQRAMDGDR